MDDEELKSGDAKNVPQNVSEEGITPSEEKVEAPKPSQKDKVKGRMRQKYADDNLDDDEVLFGKIGDEFDEFDAKDKENSENMKKFSDMFSSDPRAATLMLGWRDGKDPTIELIRLFGDELRDALDDPDKLELIADAQKDYIDRVSKEKGYEEEYQKNLEESLTGLKELVSGGEYSDEEVDEAIEWLMTLVTDVVMGKIDREKLEVALKAINYDSDIEIADREGEVRGRNAKIEEKLKKRRKGDSLPNIGSKTISSDKNNGAAGLGALGRYGDGMDDIWSRGGLK